MTATAAEVQAAPRLLEEKEYAGKISSDELEEIIDRAMDYSADGAAALIVNIDQPGLAPAESAAAIYEELSQMVRVPLVLETDSPEAVKGLRTYKGVGGLMVKEANSPLCALARELGVRVFIC
jgi:cobalamin-dependent methionine synthase I